MKLKPAELLVLVLLLSRGRRGAPAQGGKWVPEPGPEPLEVVPLPPNPLEGN